MNKIKLAVDKIKPILVYIGTALSIFCLTYYTIKFYFDGKLIFGNNKIFMWTILVMIILATLLLGVINNKEIITVKQQNKELVYIVNKILERQDETCDEILETLQNSREISLDIYNKINRKGD